MIFLRPSFALAVLLAFTSTGCFWKKHPRALPAVPPPAPKPTGPLQPAPPPPDLATEVPVAIPPVSSKLPDTPQPPPPKPAARNPRRATVPAVVKPPVTPDADAGAAPSSPAPKLGDLMTDAQRDDLLKKCDRTIQGVRASLDSIAGKALSQEATESMGRVRVFLLQAEQTRERDPQTAMQLAQRAEVLARDLLKSTR